MTITMFHIHIINKGEHMANSFKDNVKAWFQPLMRSPAGTMVATALINAAVEANLRPTLNQNGADICIQMAPGQVQVDFASRRVGQITTLWRQPAPVLANPTQLKPVDQMWNDIMAATAANDNANNAQEATAEEKTE